MDRDRSRVTWVGVARTAFFVWLGCLYWSTPVAQITFSNVSAQAGFAAKSTSYGASWGDVNGDGWPDIFLNNHARKHSIYVNNGDGTFTESINRLDPEQYWTGAGALEDTHGATWVDFDNDGDQDLIVSTGICCNPQFMLNQNGKLYNRTVQYGFGNDADKGGRMPIWFDMNRDGLLETTLLTFYGAPLLKQSGGTFVNGKSGTGYSCNDNQYAVLIDLDDDGSLELICVKSGGPFAQAWDMSHLPFVDVTSALPSVTNVNDIVVGDFDNNLRNDMLLLSGALRPSEAVSFNGNRIEAQFVNNDRGFNFRSTGVLQVTLDWNKTFTNFSNIYIGQNGVHPSAETFSLDPSNPSTHGVKPHSSTSSGLFIGYDVGTQMWSFDVYSGGAWIYTYLEISSSANISNFSAHGIKGVDLPLAPHLLSNLPSGVTDRTAAANLGAKISCVSGVAGDFDNDMDKDIYLACRAGVRNIENILLENDGNGVFTQVAGAGGAAGATGMAVADQVGASESVVLADYDRDGRLDFLVANGMNMRPHHRNNGPYQLFRNTSAVRHWVELDLVGTVSNRDAVGARVYATAGGVTQLWEQNEGYHRWSQNFRRVHFGLAENTTVNLRIDWPSGETDVYNNVAANKLYRVTELTGIVAVNGAGGGGGGGVGGVGSCGAPDYTPGVDHAVFIWKDCDQDRWHWRTVAGTGFIRNIAELDADTAIGNLQPFSLEGNDVLSNSPPSQLDFDLRVGVGYQDGFDFTLACSANATVSIQQPAGLTVLIGADRQTASVPFNLTDFVCN